MMLSHQRLRTDAAIGSVHLFLAYSAMTLERMVKQANAPALLCNTALDERNVLVIGFVAYPTDMALPGCVVRIGITLFPPVFDVDAVYQ